MASIQRRSRLPLVALAFALALVLMAPSGAAAAGCGGSTAPAGNSEVDQYSETVPNGCGNQTVKPPRGGGSNAVPPATAAQLQAQGEAGRAALSLAQSGAPAGAKAKGGKSPDGTSGTSGGSATASPSGERGGGGIGDLLDGVTSAVGGDSSDGGGLGLLLPVLIVAIAIGGAAYTLRRRRLG